MCAECGGGGGVSVLSLSAPLLPSGCRVAGVGLWGWVCLLALWWRRVGWFAFSRSVGWRCVVPLCFALPVLFAGGGGLLVRFGGCVSFCAWVSGCFCLFFVL